MPDVDFLGRPIGGGQVQQGGVDFLGRPIGGAPVAPGSPGEGGIISSTLSVLAPALDFLSRGQYASAGFFDALINDNASIGQALSLAGSELYDPRMRKSFRDVLQRSNPDFVANNPKTASVLGFLGDVALDPTTYIGLGLGAATKGARIGGRALTTLGEAYQTAARGALAGRELTLGVRAAGREAGEVLARETLTRLPGSIAAGASIATGNAGDLLRAGASSVGKDIRAVLGRLPAGISEAQIDDLAGKISMERLGLRDLDSLDNAITTVTRQGDYGEILQTADQLVSQIAGLSPELERAIFKPGGLRLVVGVPFTPAQASIPIINRDILRAVGLDRLDGVVRAVGALPGIKQALNAGEVLRGAFDRFYKLDPAYVETITKLQNEFDFIKYDVVRDSQELVKDITREGRERISRVMNGFQAGIEGLDDAQRLAEAPNVFRVALRGGQLTPKEQAVTMSLIQGYARAAELERAALIAGQSAANFDPRIYQAIANNADEAADWMRRVNGTAVDATGLTGDAAKKAADLAAAVAQGANLDQDAVLLYATKVIQARQKLPKMQAEGALKAIFGTADPAKLPKRVANDWRYFGEYRFPTFASDESSEILGAVDWLQRKWKASKTVVNPSFAPKQAIQNALQSTLVMGNNAYRAFDPRSYSAAAQILFGKKTPVRQGLPQLAEEWLAKFSDPGTLDQARGLATANLNRADEAMDLAKGLELTLPTGQKVTRDELELLARQNGILRGTSGFSGEALKRSLESEIGLGKADSFTGKAWEGTKALANGYLGLSSKVEDTSRLALFINGLMMGDSPVQAANRVNRALFDYGRSFSRFEQEVMKRLVPFYSFNRLALPLVLRTTLESPGAPAGVNKVAELIGNLVTGDKDGNPVTLSQADREIFGRSFLIEQPRIFKGLDASGNLLFNTFSNLTPFDTLSLFTVTRKNGEIDWQRTAEKSVGGMLTPFLKIPAEVLANRDFFTGRVIEAASGGAGRLGAIKDKQLDAVIPDAIKPMLGWEWGQDRRTGQQIAYVNPWLSYTTAQLAPPVARQFIKPLGDDESVLERAMRMTLGIGEQSLDIKQSLDIQNAEDKRYLQELRSKIRTAQRQGRQNSLAEAQEQYRTVLRALASRGQYSTTEAP